MQILYGRRAEDRKVITLPQVKKDSCDIEYADFPETPFITDKISMRFLKNKLIYLLYVRDNVLYVAASNTEDYDVLDAIKIATGFEVKALTARDEDISRAIEQHYKLTQSNVDQIILLLKNLMEIFSVMKGVSGKFVYSISQESFFGCDNAISFPSSTRRPYSIFIINSTNN